MSKIDNTFGPGGQFSFQKPRQSNPTRAFGELMNVDSEESQATHSQAQVDERDAAPYTPFGSFFGRVERDDSTENRPTERRVESRQTTKPETEEEPSKPGYRPKRPLGRHYEFEKDPFQKEEELHLDSSLTQPNPLTPFQVPMQIDRMPVVAETQSASPVIQPQMLDQIVQDVRIGINAMGAAEFQFDLKSDVLDGLKLKISTQDGKVTASFIAENVHVKDAIDQGTQELIQALQQRGLEVAEVQVSVGADTSGEHRQHEQHEPQSWTESGVRASRASERSVEPDTSEAINSNTRYTI